MFADLRGRRCLVIGGGLVAQRKVTTLLQYGARLTVISPAATQQLKRYARQGKLRYIPRRFRPADLTGAWLVYAATNESAINELVFQTAERLRIFTNVVDQKPLCSFIAPAIVKRGDLIIAISTGGASPTVAKHLRRELERTVGLEYARLLRLLKSLRGIAKRRMPGYNDRKRLFHRLATGRVADLVRSGSMRQARRAALALLNASAKNGR